MNAYPASPRALIRLVTLFVFAGATLAGVMAAEDAGLRRTLQPLHPVVPPTPARTGWTRNPVDAFVLAGLERAHMAPVTPANRLTLLRRAFFDLIGLPPSPEDIERFVADKRPDAFQELIDRLLASPRYGERWGRHWLDLVRYADTGGFEKDLPYPKAWKFRDYVIHSFNSNKPFDRFIQEQIAGDELWPDNPEARLGTALFAIGPASQDSALNSTQLEYEWLTDSADTTGAAFLGLTLGCARCHNHKYDPITQQDYFAIQAIFAASDRPYPPAIREHRIKGLNGILADVPIPNELLQDPRCTIQTDEQAGPGLFHRDPVLEVHRLKRGELSKPLEIVEPALPVVFGVNKQRFDPAAVPAVRRRAVLANWLVSAENPLTARVLVNRVWAWHFGKGIVRTPNDFGAQGEAPTHPELLDWLARDFIDHGWDLKRLHRLMMTSATYQLASSGISQQAIEADSNNRLLSHFQRNRLDAESVWDSLHAVSGTLNLKQFGPPVVPELSKEELSGLFDEKSWKPSKDPAEYTRRGVYVFERRTFLLPILDAFDPPDVMASCPRRFQTLVPTQALALLNSTVAQSQARAFAQRLLRDCDGHIEKIPARAWLLAFNRPVTQPEKRRALDFLRKHQAELFKPANSKARILTSISGRKSEPLISEAPLESALTELCLALFNANEFVFID